MINARSCIFLNVCNFRLELTAGGGASASASGWRGRARPERSKGGATNDAATRYDRRAFGVAVAGGTRG